MTGKSLFRLVPCLPCIALTACFNFPEFGTMPADGPPAARDGGPAPGDGGTNGGPAGLFIDSGPSHEGGAEVIIDAQGGVHMIHSSGGSGIECGGPVRYGYCAPGSRCDRATSWGWVTIAGAGSVTCDGSTQEPNMMLATDGQGHPRILNITIGLGAMYSECNSNCTSTSSWISADLPTQAVLGNPNADGGAGRHYFAVSPAGVAAFAYSSNEGLVYGSCGSNCTGAANWQQTVIVPQLPAGPPSFQNIALAFDAMGRPRMSYFFPVSEELYYAACDTECSAAASWKQVVLENDLEAARPLLALDGQGRPRILAHVQQQGSHAASDQWGWCDANCTSLLQSGWQGPVVTSTTDAMVLDAAGNPHIVGECPGGICHTWCTAGCTSTSPTWNEAILPDTDMDAADPMAGGPMAPYWMTESSTPFRPALAVNRAGDAVITTDGWRTPWLGPPSDKQGVFLRIVPLSQ